MVSSSPEPSSSSASAPPPALEAIGLSKSYGEHLALDGLDLRVEAGEILCLLGANGAGKTTTIHCFLGFLEPSAGSARVAGLDVATEVQAARRRVAFVPETVHLYPELNGFENLAYLTALARGGADPTRDEMVEHLGRVGIRPEVAERCLGTYSKGMRQKIGLAAAIAKQADALLLDEPTSGLDPAAANELTTLLERLAEDGVAVLMATHDLFRARDLGHRLGIMKQGRLVDHLDSGEIGHAELEKLYLDHMAD